MESHMCVLPTLACGGTALALALRKRNTARLIAMVTDCRIVFLSSVLAQAQYVRTPEWGSVRHMCVLPTWCNILAQPCPWNHLDMAVPWGRFYSLSDNMDHCEQVGYPDSRATAECI